jgi:hypothetical protein
MPKCDLVDFSKNLETLVQFGACSQEGLKGDVIKIYNLAGIANFVELNIFTIYFLLPIK